MKRDLVPDELVCFFNGVRKVGLFIINIMITIFQEFTIYAKKEKKDFFESCFIRDKLKKIILYSVFQGQKSI